MQQAKIKIKLEDLCFYFDGVERDRVDASGVSRKSAEILALRESLLNLPEQTFEATVSTMKSLVKDVSKTSDGTSDGKEGKRQRRDAATQLYDQAKNARNVRSTVDKVTAG